MRETHRATGRHALVLSQELGFLQAIDPSRPLAEGEYPRIRHRPCPWIVLVCADRRGHGGPPRPDSLCFAAARRAASLWHDATPSPVEEDLRRPARAVADRSGERGPLHQPCRAE